MPQAKTVLITGCSSGIGLCLAQGLQQRGYRVFASARQPQDVERLMQMGLESLPLDLRDPASIRQAVEDVMQRCSGQLDALINNGAYGQPGAVEDLRREVLRQQFETNLFGTHELTNAIIPYMRKQGQGRIIQISSVLGLVCLAYRGAYNMSKFALEALSDTLRLELRGSGLQVSLVEPGPITSRFRDNAYAAYRANIDPQHSAHKQKYLAMERRLQGATGEMPFTLPPEAVLKKVMHALEAKRARVRYYVTFPTYLLAVLKTILPVRWLDRVLLSVSDGKGK